MSRSRLCTLLGELGYQGADTLDPDSFEWPFQYDDARPILDWICSSLRSSNVLSPSDLSQYAPFLLFPITISAELIHHNLLFLGMSNLCKKASCWKYVLLYSILLLIFFLLLLCETITKYHRLDIIDDREKIWTLLMIAFQPFLPVGTTRRLFLGPKKD